jgi:hypothetical protein
MRLQTFTGRLVHPMRLTVDDVDIRDIAHALSMLCRFGGHAQQFYSVAQHSFLASQLVPPDEALWALLHDASEAYLVDVPTPLKRLAAMSGYRAVEAQVQLTICHAFGLSHEMPASVHAVDGRPGADRGRASARHRRRARLRRHPPPRAAGGREDRPGGARRRRARLPEAVRAAHGGGGMTPALVPPAPVPVNADALSHAIRLLALSRYLLALRREARAVEAEIAATTARLGEA